MSEKTDRRGFLSKTAAAAAGLGAAYSMEERILLAAINDGTAAGQKSAPAQPMPCGKIGKTTISRLIIGGNLIGGWAHSRDLLYASTLFKAYNTDAKVFETLELAERHGVNTIQIDPACAGVVNKYRRERKSKLQTIVCTGVLGEHEDKAAMRDRFKGLIDSGATMLYTQGVATDGAIGSGQIDALGQTVDLIKEQGCSAGVGGHALQVPKACEKARIACDFYVKTFHSGNYPSFTGNCDNRWCDNAEETAAFMATITKPWLAFKVLAAGAISPRQGFANAFRNGADFIIVGMFDFQIEEDVRIALDALRKTQKRPRPWRA